MEQNSQKAKDEKEEEISTTQTDIEEIKTENYLEEYDIINNSFPDEDAE
jgi:hypothetical protein